MEFKRIAPSPLTFIGWGALQQLGNEIGRFRPNKVLLITDPVLVEVGLAKELVAILEQIPVHYDLFTDIIPEPTLETAEGLIQHIRKASYELIIGFGGGSVLDLAKLGAVLAVHEGNINEYLNLTGSKQIQKPGIPKILIPTTSGTGSEVTNISVLSLGTTKDVIAHDHLLADVAIVDPRLTITLPPHITAATGIDALTHAIESYISVNANPVSDQLALGAIRLIGRSLSRVVHHGTDKQSRIDMAYGSYMAGLAFFNAGVGGVHALAYPLGGLFHIPHGVSNAVLLPYVMAYIKKSCSQKLANILSALGEDSGMGEDEACQNCIDKICSLVKDVGIPSSLQHFGISEAGLDQLTEDAVKQKRLLARSPMPLLREDIYQIYRSAYFGIIEGVQY